MQRRVQAAAGVGLPLGPYHISRTLTTELHAAELESFSDLVLTSLASSFMNERQRLEQLGPWWCLLHLACALALLPLGLAPLASGMC